jgi:hypothetical protein
MRDVAEIVRHRQCLADPGRLRISAAGAVIQSRRGTDAKAGLINKYRAATKTNATIIKATSLFMASPP